MCARVAKTKTAPREAELLRCAAVPQLLTAGARGSASRESRFSLFSQPRGRVLPTGAWANQCDSLPSGASGCAEDAGAPSPALKVTLLCSPLFQGGAPDPGQSELARTSPQPPPPGSQLSAARPLLSFQTRKEGPAGIPGTDPCVSQVNVWPEGRGREQGRPSRGGRGWGGHEGRARNRGQRKPSSTTPPPPPPASPWDLRPPAPQPPEGNSSGCQCGLEKDTIWGPAAPISCPPPRPPLGL